MEWINKLNQNGKNFEFQEGLIFAEKFRVVLTESGKRFYNFSVKIWKNNTPSWIIAILAYF